MKNIFGFSGYLRGCAPIVDFRVERIYFLDAFIVLVMGKSVFCYEVKYMISDKVSSG